MRSLEREIAKMARKAVMEIVTKKAKKVAITRKNLEKFAGVKMYRYGETEDEDMVGVVTGLAWTEVGGEILTIESVLLPGKGNIKHTGKLGDVMQESVSAALSYVRSRGDHLRHSSRPCSRSATSMSTCRRGRLRRTARLPAWRWRPAWSASSPVFRSVETWR